MANVMITCDVCDSGIYVTDEEIKSKADFVFASNNNKEINVCQYCIRRIKSRYAIQFDAAAMQIVKDFSRHDLRKALGLS